MAAAEGAVSGDDHNFIIHLAYVSKTPQFNIGAIRLAQDCWNCRLTIADC
jgi:hypothetical protein